MKIREEGRKRYLALREQCCDAGTVMIELQIVKTLLPTDMPDLELVINIDVLSRCWLYAGDSDLLAGIPNHLLLQALSDLKSQSFESPLQELRAIVDSLRRHIYSAPNSTNKEESDRAISLRLDYLYKRYHALESKIRLPLAIR